MRKKLTKILFILIIMNLTVNTFGDVKLRTEEEVAAYVDSITGFGRIKGIKKTFKQVVVTDDNTPFLHKQINGRKNVWLAEYRDFKLEIFTVPTEDKYTRNFKIYIDANDGTLLKITSKFEGYDPNLPKEPNAATAERQVKGESYEFPKEPPKISFINALGSAQIGTFSSPLQAKEVDGLYVLYFNPRYQNRRVWIISTRGQPPGPIMGGGRYLSMEEIRKIQSQESYFRTFIDADTGKPLWSDNAIRPEEP